jgi:TRAP-type C4-dicarboxylate transport system substrate-binding protein
VVRRQSDLVGFVVAVSHLSHGSLRVKIEPGWRNGDLAYETHTIRDVQAGKADLGAAASRSWDTVGIAPFRALNAPFLIDSYALEQRVAQSSLARALLARLRPLGLVGLGILPSPLRRPLGSTKALLRPADFAGLRIGTQESGVADETLRMLGAVPVRLAANQKVDLRKLGGVEQRASGVAGQLLDRKGEYYSTNVDLWPRPLVVFANERTFAALTADEQRALRDAVTSLIPAQVTFERETDTESVGDMCRRGALEFARATPSELAELRTAVQPVYDHLDRDPATRRAIRAINVMKRDLAGPPEALPGCPSAPGANARVRTPLDGVWEMDTRRAAAGNDHLAENWGKWIYLFDHGRFADTQENRDACTWGYGTFTIKGSRTSWSFVNGGGIAPNDAENKPGEFFEFRWSRYRDTATLSAWPGAISPTNFDSQPWRLISATPTRRYFSTRCPPPPEALAP